MGLSGDRRLARAVLEQAVTDYYLGRPGKTISGKPYPGGRLCRQRVASARAKALRHSAEEFFFAPSSNRILKFWLTLADVDLKPNGIGIPAWLEEQIDARKTRAWYWLGDGDDDLV